MKRLKSLKLDSCFFTEIQSQIQSQFETKEKFLNYQFLEVIEIHQLEIHEYDFD